MTGDSSISLRSSRPRVSRGVARPLSRARTVARAQARMTQGRATARGPLLGEYLMSDLPVVVGVDVAKAELVVALRPGGESWTVTNDETGILQLLQRLRPQAPALVVFEATGGYERGRRRARGRRPAAGRRQSPPGARLRALDGSARQRSQQSRKAFHCALSSGSCKSTMTPPSKFVSSPPNVRLWLPTTARARCSPSKRYILGWKVQDSSVVRVT